MKKYLPILFAVCAMLCACHNDEPIQPHDDVYISSFTIEKAAEYTTNYEVTFTGVDKKGNQVIVSPVYRIEDVSGEDLPYLYKLKPSLYLGKKSALNDLDYISVTLTLINYDQYGNKYSISLINDQRFFPLIIGFEETYTISNEYGYYTMLVNLERR